MKINYLLKITKLLALLSLTFSFFFSASVQAKPPAKAEAKSFRFDCRPGAYTDEMKGSIRNHGENLIDAQNIWIGLTFTQDGGRTWKQMILTPRIKRLLGYEESDRKKNDHVDLMVFFLNTKRGWLSAYNAYKSDSTWQTEDGGYS